MEVIALRDMLGGEEIQTSYLDASLETPSWQRQDKIGSQWNFRCRCPICSGPEVRGSNFRRRQIAQIKEKLHESRTDVAALLKHVVRLLDLYEQEAMIMPRADYYELAAFAANHLGREEQALEFAASARKYWNILFGSESREVKAIEEFERDPKKHPSRG
jgi:hypothetical protein